MNSRSPAHLTAGLLSRKGMAAPSAGSDSRTNMIGRLADPDSDPDSDLDSDLDSHMDAETTRPQPSQAPAPARSTLADWIAPEPAPTVGAPGRQDLGVQKRVRVSLRLDTDRHTRLKLVATQRNCTLQTLFTEAIDEFFVRHAPDLHGISRHLRHGIAATALGEKARSSKQDSEGRNGPLQSR